MKEIVIVAPIKAMPELARQVIADAGYSGVEVMTGNMRDGLESARLAIRQGAEVIISRGGTYEMIRADTDLPVVEVKVNAFDLIDSFKEAKRIDADGLIGVIGYANVILGADVVADVMGLRTVIFQINSKSDIAAEVDRQIAMGVRVFVGDGNVESAVARYDGTTILVNSGPQAIRNAIQEAQGILAAARQEKEKAQQFETIIDFVHDGIIAINDRGVVTVFNSASEKIVGRNRSEALGRSVSDVIPETRLLNILKTRRPEIGDIQQLDRNTVIATNRVPVIVDGAIKGAVATYQDITEVQRLEQKIRIRLAEKGFVAQYTFADIIHQSTVMRECIRTAHKFAGNDASVLISGPTGVGKELFAQGIHNSSRRKNSPFVAINCAALPESLIESELFGYVEGSFTGAAKRGKAGLFEMAHGGTVFLDEISELPIVLQGRLLRVLQEKEVMRIGDSKLIPVDVRVVCATNRDLRSLVAQKLFRGDLYFRIAILSLDVPALAERLEDVEVLSRHFVEDAARRYRKADIGLGPQALAFLRGYDYSGNVRELQGMIERAVVVCESSVIAAGDLVPSPGPRIAESDAASGVFFPDGLTLRDLEERYIGHVFAKTNRSVKASSDILGIDRTTLWRRIKGSQALGGATAAGSGEPA